MSAKTPDAPAAAAAGQEESQANQRKKAKIDFGQAPRVDLLPASEKERRARIALAQRWGAIAVGAIAVIGLLSSAALGWRLMSSSALTSEQNTSSSLLASLAGFSEVSTALNTTERVNSLRPRAMSTDIDWVGVYRSLDEKLPSGAEIVGLSMAVGGAPTGDVPAESTPGVFIASTIESTDPVDHAELMQSFATIPGVLGVNMTLLTESGTGAYFYDTTISFNQDIYSGKHEGEAS